MTVSARLVSSVLIFADSDERLESEGDSPRNTGMRGRVQIAQDPLPRVPRVPRFPLSESLSTKHSSRRDQLSVWSSSTASPHETIAFDPRKSGIDVENTFANLERKQTALETLKLGHRG